MTSPQELSTEFKLLLQTVAQRVKEPYPVIDEEYYAAERPFDNEVQTREGISLFCGVVPEGYGIVPGVTDEDGHGLRVIAHANFNGGNSSGAVNQMHYLIDDGNVFAHWHDYATGQDREWLLSGDEMTQLTARIQF
jgi:hypothetical protein